MNKIVEENIFFILEVQKKFIDHLDHPEKTKRKSFYNQITLVTFIAELDKIISFYNIGI